MTRRDHPVVHRRSTPFALKIAAALLLVAFPCRRVTVAFVHLSATQSNAFGVFRESTNHRHHRVAHATKTTSAATQTPTAEYVETDLYSTATKLLGLVLEKRNEEIKPPFEAWLRRQSPSYERVKEQRSKAIEALIEELSVPALEGNRRKSPGFLDRLMPQPQKTLCYYDPAESLFGGGFYCTLYFCYPNTPAGQKPPEDPIWEKTSLNPSNIKGQQYYIRNDFRQSVINYSEIWGPDVTITAEGVLTPVDADDENGADGNKNGSTKTKKDSRSLRRLPDFFQVDATKVSASFFGLTVNFDIQGTGNLCVLYADPRIRVFVSPRSTESVVGSWEEAGLVVVQVRGDLVPAKDEWTPQVKDLRG